MDRLSEDFFFGSWIQGRYERLLPLFMWWLVSDNWWQDEISSKSNGNSGQSAGAEVFWSLPREMLGDSRWDFSVCDDDEIILLLPTLDLQLCKVLLSSSSKHSRLSGFPASLIDWQLCHYFHNQRLGDLRVDVTVYCHHLGTMMFRKKQVIVSDRAQLLTQFHLLLSPDTAWEVPNRSHDTSPYHTNGHQTSLIQSAVLGFIFIWILLASFGLLKFIWDHCSNLASSVFLLQCTSCFIAWICPTVQQYHAWNNSDEPQMNRFYFHKIYMYSRISWIMQE